MPTNGMSKTNDNKTFDIREAAVKFLILTNSVTPLIGETLVTLYNNGNSRSVHYLINKAGLQDQFAYESMQTFTNGKSYMRGNHSLNQTAVNVMLINSGNETYPKEQIAKFIKFASDFQERNPNIDLKIDFFGLGEVAYIKKEVSAGEGKIFPRHQAPGEIFWQQYAEKLAEKNIGLYIPTTYDQKTEICVSPASSQCEITELQNKLRDYGYAIEASGKYDEATKAWVTRFNQRYVPDATQTIDATIWSEASQLSLNHILNYIANTITNTVTQSSSANNFFIASAPAENADEVKQVSTLKL